MVLLIFLLAENCLANKCHSLSNYSIEPGRRIWYQACTPLLRVIVKARHMILCVSPYRWMEFLIVGVVIERVDESFILPV